MGRHRQKHNHDWKVILRKWCFSDEQVKATLEGREPEWLDTLECTQCEAKDVQKHNPDLPPPTA